MSKKLIFLASFALLLCATADVQADLTEVLNPSFEDDWTGWHHRTSYTFISAEGGNVAETPYGGNWAELGNGTLSRKLTVNKDSVFDNSEYQSIQGLCRLNWA